MADVGYKVRIRQPDPGEAGMLATMIAPFVDLDVDALESTLRQGPAVVDNLEQAEAEQLVRLFARMGATADVLAPAGSQAPTELAEVAWRSTPFGGGHFDDALSGDRGPSIQETQPFDASALRRAIEERGARQSGRGETAPPVVSESIQATTSTQPFSARAVRQAMAEAVLSGPTGRPASTTQPVDAERLAKATALSRQESIRPGHPPRAPLRGRPASISPEGAQEEPPYQSSLPPPVNGEHLPPMDAGPSATAASMAFDPLEDGVPTPDLGSVPPARLSGGRGARVEAPKPRRSVPAIVGSPVRRQVPVAPARPTGGHPIPDRHLAAAIQARGGYAAHSPTAAALLSLLLPGMGQIYNGQRTRAVWFALGTPLILPWVWAIADAWAVGQNIVERRTPAPDPTSRRLAIPGQLVLDLAIFVAVAGAIFLYNNQRRARAWRPPAAPVTAPAPPPRAPATIGTIAPATTARAPQTVEQLLAAGKNACAEGRFAECEQAMLEVVKRQPGHVQAHRLLVDARSQRAARPAPTTATPTVAPSSEAP